VQVEPLRPDTIPAWMFGDHVEESCPNKEVFKLKPDWAYYFREQREGRFFMVSARNENWDIVGYVGMFIRPHHHYSDVVMATDDLHYLLPAYRGQKLGAFMLAFAEKVAAEKGASIFLMRCKANQPHGKIFEDMGYKLTDLTYLKDIRNARA